MEILRTQTLEGLFNFYNDNRDNFNVINVCTCFNRAVQLMYSTNKKAVPKLREKREIQQMVDHLKGKTEQMNGFTISNFLSNLAKLGLEDADLINKLVQRTLTSKIHHNEKSLTYITWALGRFKIYNEEFLNLVAKEFKDTVINNLYVNMLVNNYLV